MTTLWQRLEPKLAAYKLRDESNGNYRLNSPLRAGSNSHAFHIVVNADGNSGAYIDHARGERGSLAALAEQLGVEVERKQATNTKRAYVNPFYYAEAHGVDWQVFEAAGWSHTTQHDTNGKERPALKIPTMNGSRYRFLDGEKPTYHSPAGYKNCWYGLFRAVVMDGDIVLCNGPASVVVAQHMGIAAVSLAGGGQRIPDHLLKDLLSNDKNVIIALDCDNEGRAATQNYSEQLPGARIVDLGLTDGGDLADFCMLYQEGTYAELLKRAVAIPTDDTPKPIEANGYRIVKRSTMLTNYLERVYDTDKPPQYPPLIFPLTVLHNLGGMAKVVKPGKMLAFVGTSGSGKTSCLETLADLWLAKGVRICCWSPEWGVDELVERSVQRCDGPSDVDMSLHELYKHELASGKTSGFDGKPLSHAQEDSAALAVRKLRGWSGDMLYLQMPFAKVDTLREAVDDIMQNETNPPQVLMFDYAQLLHAMERQEKSMYEVTSHIKAMCIHHNLVGVVATQATKADSKDAKRGAYLDTQSARYVNDDHFNLFVTLNPEYTEFSIPMDTAVINVCKNSQGMTGKRRVLTHLDKHLWLDELSPNQTFKD